MWNGSGWVSDYTQPDDQNYVKDAAGSFISPVHDLLTAQGRLDKLGQIGFRGMNGDLLHADPPTQRAKLANRQKLGRLANIGNSRRWK